MIDDRCERQGTRGLWTSSLRLYNDMPFNAVVFYALYSDLPQPSHAYKVAGAPEDIACSILQKH